jgi:hypothetical protein
LIGCPISRSLTTSCVCLELRPLPSPGVTRLQRYCEPLRHPTAPSLSLAGVWLVIPDHALGLPVLRTLSLCACCRHYPGAAAGRRPRSSHPAVTAFPDNVVGSACTSSFSRIAQPPDHSPGVTRVAARTLARSPIRDQLHRRLQPFCHLHDCSGCFRLERSPGGACTHWKAPPCHGAHVKRTLRIAAVGVAVRGKLSVAKNVQKLRAPTIGAHQTFPFCSSGACPSGGSALAAVSLEEPGLSLIVIRRPSRW